MKSVPNNTFKLSFPVNAHSWQSVFVEEFLQVFSWITRNMLFKGVNRMIERIVQFTKELENKNHIIQLLKNLDLCLTIETVSDGAYYLYFQKNKIELRGNKSIPADSYATIRGEKNLLNSLFDGEVKLREGVSLNYFQLNCPFRTLLVLESIFFLGKPLPL
jgi:hypothetical protein